MNSLKHLNKYFFSHKKKLILGFIFILCSNLFQVMIPLQLRKGIDGIIADQDISQIINYSFYIVGAALLSG
ncbi:MAG: ABC transporter ATP-binding protein, partial [Ignavibacteria bacterium]